MSLLILNILVCIVILTTTRAGDPVFNSNNNFTKAATVDGLPDLVKNGDATVTGLPQNDVDQRSHSSPGHHEGASNSTIHESSVFIAEIFNKYGREHVMDFEGFEHLLANLGLTSFTLKDHSMFDHLQANESLHFTHNHTSEKDLESDEVREESGVRKKRYTHLPKGNHLGSRHGHPEIVLDNHNLVLTLQKQCLSPDEILSQFNIHTYDTISEHIFLHICPAVIYEMDIANCMQKFKMKMGDVEPEGHAEIVDVTTKKIIDIPMNVWGAAVAAIFIISSTGLLVVAVVPLLDKAFYHYILHFLVSLAVGSLSGDALLHLFPHALGIHAQESGLDEHGVYRTKYDAVWKGLVALCGIFGFFLIEQFIQLGGLWRKSRRELKIPSEKEVKYINELEKKARAHEMVNLTSSDNCTANTAVTDANFHVRENEMIDLNASNLQQHSTEEHGHSHSFKKGVPKTMSAVATMVIMGDGLHNFSDGLAIGAAFTSNIAAGISTAIAVFCHELPHELGDFAMLLKTGMTVKTALFYNVVSSFLSFFGMLIGIILGNIGSIDMWIFAVTSGSFIYISFVDMLPELRRGHLAAKRVGDRCFQLVCQLGGIALGVFIMLIIALYEDDIRSLVA